MYLFIMFTAFRDMLNKSDKSEGAYAVRTAKTLIKITNKVSDDTDSVDGYQPTILGGKKAKSGTGGKTKLMKMLQKWSLLPKTNTIRFVMAISLDYFSCLFLLSMAISLLIGYFLTSHLEIL